MAQNQDDLPLAAAIVIFAAAFLPAVILAAPAYLIFYYVVAPRFGSVWFVWFAGGGAGAAALLALAWPPIAAGYFKAYAQLFSMGLFDKSLGASWWPLLAASPLGLGLGALWAWWRLKSLPAADRKPASGGWREKRALAKLSREKHPAEGVLLGVEQGTGKRVVVGDEELNQHLFLVGTTGSGKTTTILNFAESAMQRGLPLVLVDGKGDPGLADKAAALAEHHGRRHWRFAMSGPSAHYNPLATGGITELKDKLLYLEEWSEKHYEALAGRYLQLVFRVCELTGERPGLATVTELLVPELLEAVIKEIKDDDERDRAFGVLDEFGKGRELKGLAARLSALAESEIGHLFTPGGDTIDLDRVIRDDGVAVFSLDSLAYPDFARLLGRLVVADMKCAAARAYRRERKMAYTIFDEFGVFATRAVVDLIGKSRGAGFCAVIATQSLSDIEAAAGEAVVEQIVDNCNTFVIQRQNSPASAEKLAAVAGTKETHEITQQVEHLLPGLGAGALGSRMGTRRQVREYLVHPDEIKRLKTGEAVVVKKTNFQVVRVRIRRRGEGSR